MSADARLATAATVLALAFPPSGGEVRAGSLTTTQRAVLAKLAATEGLWQSPEFAGMLTRFGLPGTRDGLFGFLSGGCQPPEAVQHL